MSALMAKLIGNSAFGSTTTNKENIDGCLFDRTKSTMSHMSHMLHEDYRAVVSSLLTFAKYEEVTPTLLEMECRYDEIVYDQLRYIAKIIFDRVKLSVLHFYHDFIKKVLKQDSYELLETDTDSIYLALKYEKFEDNFDPSVMEEYE